MERLGQGSPTAQGTWTDARFWSWPRTRNGRAWGRRATSWSNFHSQVARQDHPGHCNLDGGSNVSKEDISFESPDASAPAAGNTWAPVDVLPRIPKRRSRSPSTPNGRLLRFHTTYVDTKQAFGLDSAPDETGTWTSQKLAVGGNGVGETPDSGLGQSPNLRPLWRHQTAATQMLTHRQSPPVGTGNDPPATTPTFF